MCRKSVQVLHRTCKPVANWRLYCTIRRLPFVDWPINLGPAQRSYVGILQRMPKPGSSASIYCTLSEHLRARPKHLCLWKREPTAEVLSRYLCRVFRIPTAAEPLDLNSQISTLFLKPPS